MTRLTALAFLYTVTAVTQSLPGPAGRASESELVGRVVDAACYLMHPDAASGRTHDECGMACAKRGVPLGVVNEADGTLYLDLEGGARLLPHIHQRVRVTGVTEKKQGPLRLELPVGQTNTMAVQLEGEYRVVKISGIAGAPAERKTDRR